MTHSAHREESTVATNNDSAMSRDHVKYQPLKSRSKPWIVAHSLFSNSFVRKWGFLCVVLCCLLGFLFYQRVLYQEYIYHTLPLFQRSVKLELAMGKEPVQPDRWKPIGDPQMRYQTFSAYFDPRLEIVEGLPTSNGRLPIGSVRVFAVLPLKIRQMEVFCHFRYAEGEVVRKRADLVEAVHENFDMPFSATSVVCKLTGDKSQLKIQLPYEVGLSYNFEPSMIDATSFVQIHYPRGNLLLRMNPSRDLAVCVGPVHSNYSNAARIVEFFEYWRLLGAERFYLYNKSITEDVSRVLGHYRDRGIAEVLEWNLEGYKFEKELRYEGIFAALNDCLYRATLVGDFHFTAMVDLDEFLLPLESAFDGENLVQFLHRRDRFDVHSFNFPAVFFYGFYEEDFSRVPRGANNTYLYTQVRTVRTKEPLMHHNRSKYVASGRTVIEAGNHFVWRALRDTKELRIAEQEGMLFHYRDRCVGYGCETFVEDSRARRYEGKIWRAVESTCRQIFPQYGGQCPLGKENN
ncbi:uncharacterized protein LOC6054363 [Culex quinquefasciatus]|uniref:uncharacterized protein LOC6054363 n=1 Tax=Culex quinquefasciatus TaxID=7176 RepID=UPI0018E3096E|nr:uncharacterized protein LOC6054363 [Culex quinquefasciatus]